MQCKWLCSANSSRNVRAEPKSWAALHWWPVWVTIYIYIYTTIYRSIYIYIYIFGSGWSYWYGHMNLPKAHFKKPFKIQTSSSSFAKKLLRLLDNVTDLRCPSEASPCLTNSNKRCFLRSENSQPLGGLVEPVYCVAPGMSFELSYYRSWLMTCQYLSFFGSRSPVGCKMLQVCLLWSWFTSRNLCVHVFIHQAITTAVLHRAVQRQVDIEREIAKSVA